MITESVENVEKAVLGVLIRDGAQEVIQAVDPDDFSAKVNRELMRLIGMQVTDDEPYDMITLVERGRERGVSVSADYISGLTTTVASRSNIMFYVDLLKERAHKRDVRLAAEYLAKNTGNGNYLEARDGMMKVLNREPRTGPKILGMPAKDVLIKGFEGKREDRVSLGFSRLDRLLEGGVMMGQYTLITGKSGHGKSTLAWQIILNLCSHRRKVWLGSFEMTPFYSTQEMMRQTGLVPNRQNVEAFDRYVNQSLWVSGTAGVLDPVAMAQEIEQHMVRHGCRFFFVDNLTVMEAAGSGERYERQVALVQNVLRFSLNHNVHFFLLVHLRKNNKGAKASITLDDIIGAGDIAKLAHAVLLVERGKEENTGRVMVMKSRTLGMGKSVRLRFNEHFRNFTEDD